MQIPLAQIRLYSLLHHKERVGGKKPWKKIPVDYITQGPLCSIITR